MECAVDIPSGEDEAPEKDDTNAKEENEPPHKKNKKHRKHKSKKKKRKRKGEKESSSESGAESDVEPPPPPRPVRTTRASARLAAAAGTGDHDGLQEDSKRDVITDRGDTEADAKSKKHKRHAAKKKKKKKKKDEKQEKKSPSRSPSESSSASGSESEGEGGKGAGDAKYSAAAASDLQEPVSKLVPKSKRGEEKGVPNLLQKPELLGVKKEEISDMDVSPSVWLLLQCLWACGRRGAQRQPTLQTANLFAPSNKPRDTSDPNRRGRRPCWCEEVRELLQLKNRQKQTLPELLSELTV